MRSIELALWTLGLVSVAERALAEPTTQQFAEDGAPRSRADEAKKLFEQGIQQGRLGDYTKALEAFEQAYALSPHHRVLFNVARAAEAVGDYEKAIHAYERYLDAGRGLVDEAHRAEVVEKLQDLRLLLAERAPEPVQAAERDPQPIPIEFRCPYPGFSIRKDGYEIAATPLSGVLQMPRGTRLAIERPGYQSAYVDVPTRGPSKPYVCRALLDPQRTVHQGTIAISRQNLESAIEIDGQRVGLRTTLPTGPHWVVVRAPGHMTWSQLVTVKAGQELTLSVALLPVHSPRHEPSHTRRDWGLSLMGASVLALGTGIGFAIYNEDRANSWEAEASAIRSMPEGTARAVRSQIANAELQEIQDFDVATGIAFASAAVLATSGAALLWMPDPSFKLALGQGETTFRVQF